MKSPCKKDCPNRSVNPNCHMTCEKYLLFVEYRKSLIEKRCKANKIKQMSKLYITDVKRW